MVNFSLRMNYFKIFLIESLLPIGIATKPNSVTYVAWYVYICEWCMVGFASKNGQQKTCIHGGVHALLK